MAYKESVSRKLFKDNITSIEIGTHNYCNRTCNFCPLSRDDVNRRDKKKTKFMDKMMFQNILEQLAEIDFDGRIDFSRYHEPLSHKEDILEKCRMVNYFIPNAKISINTNADYLDRQYIDELLECYVDHIAIQAYLKNGVVEYDELGVFKRINQICKKINVPEINPDDYKGHKIISQSTSIPIATGENEYTKFGFRDLIEQGNVSILQPDVLIMGGVTEFMKVAAMSQAHEIPIAPHGSQDVHIHLVTAIPNGLILEYYAGATDPMYGKTFKYNLDVRDGYVHVPDRSGFGIEINEEILLPFRVA